MRRMMNVALGGPWIPCLLIVVLLAGSPEGRRGTRASAAVPPVVPSFSSSLSFTNPYFPFHPGAMKVFAGQSDGDDITVVERHLEEVRTFSWNGAEIPCAIVKETEFQAGDLLEISLNYYAQADDGSIWFFGEVAESYENGTVVPSEGTWLVGGPAPGDPPGTATGDAPALHLPANPEVGDAWIEENLPEHQIREERRVLRASKRVRVPAGRFDGGVEVEERDADGEVERKWYAPGTGIVKVKGDDENLKLVATTVRPR